MAVGIICRLELYQEGVDVICIYLPGGPEASGAHLREGKVPGLYQSWRKWKVTKLKGDFNHFVFTYTLVVKKTVMNLSNKVVNLFLFH